MGKAMHSGERKKEIGKLPGQIGSPETPILVNQLLSQCTVHRTLALSEKSTLKFSSEQPKAVSSSPKQGLDLMVGQLVWSGSYYWGLLSFTISHAHS